MVSPLLVKSNKSGHDIVTVTPASAGWTHVGFQAIRIATNGTRTVTTGCRELCLVVLTGTVDITVDGDVYESLGQRDSVFDAVGPASLYVPKGKTLVITGRKTAEIALCTAPCDDIARDVRLIQPEDTHATVRGAGTNTRFVRDILPHDDPTAAHLLVVEVRTPASHSSSYPPHKHDTERPPIETQLEETYYHRLNPPQGFAFQRVYTDDRQLDEACAVENHDVVMVPRGYHPVVVPHGYESYYLNVMAGPNRFWVFKNDPAHTWMLEV